MKAIIFGINGQDGYYLKQLLDEKHIEVIGISRKGPYIIGNVAEYKFVESIIKFHQPDYIFHLAANSTTQHIAIFENHETICTGTINILESVYLHCQKAKVFLSGSAMQFKNDGLPIDEQTPFEASSPYSVARIQSVYAARYYRKLGLKVYIGYFFNHDSPLRTERHITQKIAQLAKRISTGQNELFEIGDISVKKEYTFAGDIVKAIWLLIQNGKVFEVVIGSGKPYSIEDWIKICFNYYKLDWKRFITIKKGYTPEYKLLVSDPQILFSLGWKQEVEINQLANMMMGEI